MGRREREQLPLHAVEVQTALALRGYAVRDRVHLQPDQARAEDSALEAAQRDRRRGLRTLVIAQTSGRPYRLQRWR
jgi:hypothetical protein